MPYKCDLEIRLRLFFNFKNHLIRNLLFCVSVKSADNSDNKVNKVIAENDKEDSKKLSKQKPDAGDTETPSDDADVDLKSTNVVESIAEPKKEGKGIGSKSKTEDDSNSSGSTPLNNADANSPVANGKCIANCLYRRLEKTF